MEDILATTQSVVALVVLLSARAVLYIVMNEPWFSRFHFALNINPSLETYEDDAGKVHALKNATALEVLLFRIKSPKRGAGARFHMKRQRSSRLIVIPGTPSQFFIATTLASA
jgi:hypothetical protein